MSRAIPLMLIVLLTACAARSGPELNLYQGTWGGDGIRPPPNLVQAPSSNLIGRVITTRDGLALPIKAVLEDPAGRQRYVLASSPPSGDLVDVPVSALDVGPDRILLNGGRPQLVWLEHHAPDQIDKLYPPAAAAKTQPLLGGSPIPLPTATVPLVSPVPEALVLLHSSSVVGLPVVDSDGAAVGKIDAVAAVPGTGQVEYALLTGPAFGSDSYIVLPSASMQLEGNQVRLPGSKVAALEEMRRYRLADPVDVMGAVTLN